MYKAGTRMWKVGAIQPKEKKGWFARTVQEKSEQLSSTSSEDTQAAEALNNSGQANE